MKYSKWILSKYVLPGLLVISAPLAANAEPQQNEGADQHWQRQSSGELHTGHHFKQGWGAYHFPAEIALTENQRDQIFTIKHKQAALFYEQKKIVHNAHIDLKSLVTTNQYDDKKAKALTEKLGKSMANIAFLRDQQKHQVYEVLTPEQRDFVNSHQHGMSSKYSNFHPT